MKRSTAQVRVAKSRLADVNIAAPRVVLSGVSWDVELWFCELVEFSGLSEVVELSGLIELVELSELADVVDSVFTTADAVVVLMSTTGNAGPVVSGGPVTSAVVLGTSVVVPACTCTFDVDRNIRNTTASTTTTWCSFIVLIPSVWLPNK